jgi:hypothetical protein
MTFGLMDFGRRFWVIVALSLGPAVANSFARFAYALLLPAMRVELGLNYSQRAGVEACHRTGNLQYCTPPCDCVIVPHLADCHLGRHV